MSLFQYCRLLRSQWDDFARRIWPPSAHEQTQSELDHLDEELRRRQARLLQYRQKIEKLRDYLDRCERRWQWLASSAWEGTAVEELAARRLSLDRLCQRLRERERAYDRRLGRFQRRKRRRLELRDRLVFSPRARTVTSDEELSDPDYPF